MSRKRWMLTGATVVAAAATTGGVVVASGSGDPTPTAHETPLTTAPVVRGDLSDTVSLNGTLTYRARPDGSAFTVVNRATGTYTALPEVGRHAGCGDVLYRVDEHPVRLMCGTIPFYRHLHPGDTGRDVRQLNRNLHRPGSTFTGTRTFHPGDAVVLPEPGRIAKVIGRLGEPARPGTPVAQATTDTLEVQVSLEASQRGEVRRGDRARITLPGNRTVRGRVERIGTVARIANKDDGAGTATLPVSVSLDRPAKARGLDRAPAQIDVTTKGVEHVLSVPVTALVGRTGGGFAVETLRDGGRRALVAVQLGLFDTTSGRVAIRGDVAEGDRVVVPSP